MLYAGTRPPLSRRERRRMAKNRKALQAHWEEVPLPVAGPLQRLLAGEAYLQGAGPTWPTPAESSRVWKNGSPGGLYEVEPPEPAVQAYVAKRPASKPKAAMASLAKSAALVVACAPMASSPYAL